MEAGCATRTAPKKATTGMNRPKTQSSTRDEDDRPRAVAGAQPVAERVDADDLREQGHAPSGTAGCTAMVASRPRTSIATMGNTTTESIAAATSAADVGVDMCP